MGLKSFRNKDSKGNFMPRKAEWGRVDKKALSRLENRRRVWDRQSEEVKFKTHRPGSMKKG